MKTKISFDSLSDWKDYLLKALASFARGILGIVLAFFLGLFSVCAWIGKLIEAFCKRETTAAMIIGFLFCAMAFGWVFTFTKERHATVMAQHKADSLAYDLSKFTQLIDSNDVLVLNGDTIKLK